MTYQRPSGYYTNTEYKRGIDDELTVIRWLRHLGYNVDDNVSTATNISGIDCYVNGVPADIKSQKYAPHYRGFCFELEVLSRYDGWSDRGWFNTGKAEVYYYMVQHEPELYVLYEIVKSLVKRYGFDYSKTLSSSTKQRQINSRLEFINAMSGYILYENIDAVGRVIGQENSLSRFVENTKRIITRPTTKAHRILQNIPT